MDLVRSLYYIGPQMGHVTMFCTSYILGRAPRKNETLSDFVKLWVPIKGTQQCGIGVPDIHKFFVG